MQHPKVALPYEPPTYNEILQLWFVDRAAIDKLNAQLAAIKSLQGEEDDTE